MLEKLRSLLRENYILVFGIVFSLIVLVIFSVQKTKAVDIIEKQQIITLMDPALRSTLSKDTYNYSLVAITCFVNDRVSNYTDIVGYRIIQNDQIEIYLKTGEMYAFLNTTCRLDYKIKDKR